MKSPNYWANQIADLIDEGYDCGHAVTKAIGLMKQHKIEIKIERVLKEFKFLYGHDVLHYELSRENRTDDLMVDEFLKEFTK